MGKSSSHLIGSEANPWEFTQTQLFTIFTSSTVPSLFWSTNSRTTIPSRRLRFAVALHVLDFQKAVKISNPRSKKLAFGRSYGIERCIGLKFRNANRMDSNQEDNGAQRCGVIKQEFFGSGMRESKMRWYIFLGNAVVKIHVTPKKINIFQNTSNMLWMFNEWRCSIYEGSIKYWRRNAAFPIDI